MAEKGQIAWGADSLTTGGGLVDDVDAEFTNCKFMRTDYGGKSDQEVTVFSSELKFADEDTGEEQEVEQMWSCGHADLVPSEDGETEAEEGPYLINIGKAKGVNASSNFGMLVSSISMAGFPGDRFDGSAACMNGLVAHVQRVEIERKGLKKKKGEEDRKHEVLTVTNIISMPWEKKGAGNKAGGSGVSGGGSKGKTTATSKSKSSAAAKGSEAEDNPVVEEAEGIVMEILGDKGGSVTKVALVGSAFKLLKGNENRSAISKLLADADFLGGEDRPWSFDGKKLELVEE